MSLWWPCFWLALIALGLPGVSKLMGPLNRIATALEQLVELAKKGRN